MKNIILILSCVALFISATSCSKAYDCHCVYKTDGTVTHEDTHQVNEGKKEKSATSCNQGDATTTSTLNGNTYVNTTECELAE
jgi:hypothetical protein